MDILKKNLAPISDEAWQEINDQAKLVFSTDLSSRKFVDVDGPHGLKLAAVPQGKLYYKSKGESNDLSYGLHIVQSLIEVKSPFELNILSLDDISRGAEDVNLDKLGKAAKKLAAFEESAVYFGMKDANIKGLKASSVHQPVKFPENVAEILHSVTKALGELRNASVEGPYTLIVDPEKWEFINSYVNGYPLKLQIEQLLGGSLIYAPHLSGAFLVSERGGDFRLTLGQDLSIGYSAHDKTSVSLYFTESFTFQVLDPSAVLVFS